MRSIEPSTSEPVNMTAACSFMTGSIVTIDGGFTLF
jgi:hypothetical protein